MVKYNWTIYDIEERLTKLKHLLNKENEPEKRKLIKYDIENLEDMLEEYFDDSIYEQEKLLVEYEYRKKNYGNFNFLKQDFLEFERLTNDIIVPPSLPTTSLSKKDILDLTHDFFKSLNRYLFGNFMKNYSKRFDHIVFHNPNNELFRGQTSYILSLKESFISINRNFTLMDVMSTIHEYMHATSALIKPLHFFDNKYIFSELDTAFIELIAADYLDKIFKNNYGTIIKAYNHIERVSDIKDLNDTFKLINFEDSQNMKFCNNKQLKTIAKLLCDLDGEDLEYKLYMPDTLPEAYVTSYIFAIELYDLYVQDKEKALQTLRKIIQLEGNSLEDYYKQIKNLQLYPNQHMLEYHRDLQNNINKLIRIQKIRQNGTNKYWD